MTSGDWDPHRYARFAQQRDEPFWLLASLLEPCEAPRLLDLGCGDGRLTAELARKLGAREVLGVDRSPAMLEAAAGRIPVLPGDLGTWTTESRFDVVVSNSAMHWLPDHESALERWSALLDAGGQLAVQLPDNRRSAVHHLAAVLARAAGVDASSPHTALDLEAYALVLHRLRFARHEVRSHVHLVELDDRDALVDWLRGSLLTHYEHTLGDGFPEFLADFRASLPDGPQVLPYVRTYLWGRLGDG